MKILVSIEQFSFLLIDRMITLVKPIAAGSRTDPRFFEFIAHFSFQLCSWLVFIWQTLTLGG
jgi:hypothetical protein